MNPYIELIKKFKKSEKVAFYLIIFLILLSTILEIVGISILFPIFSFLLNNNETSQFLIFSNFFENIESNFNNFFQKSKFSYIQILTIIILCLFFLKSIVLTFSNYISFNFFKKIELNWNNSLFSSYIQEEYEFFLNKNSSELIRNINQCSPAINGIRALISFITEIIIVSVFLIFLLKINFEKTLIVLLFLLIISLSIYLVTANYFKKIGKRKQIEDMYFTKNLFQGINGIREIKIFAKENFFSRLVYKNKKSLTQIQFVKDLIISLPKSWFEFIAVLFLLFTANFMIKSSSDYFSLLPLLGLYAAILIKLLPSIIKLLNLSQLITYFKPALENLNKELTNKDSREKLANIEKERTENKILFNNNIDLKNVYFKYKNSSQYVLQNINLTLNKGTSVGIIGESGSGKSTLIDLVSGLITPTEGKIIIDEKFVLDNFISWRHNISYLSQNFYLNDDTIKNNIAFGVEDDLISKDKLDKAVERSGLKYFVNKLDEGLETIVGEKGAKLSGGQAQRIGIARCLYSNPNLLILDEPTSGLDPDNEERIVNTLKRLEGKTTILLITHNKKTVNFCHKIYKLENNNLIQTK